MVILVNKGGEKTKPIQSQSRAFGRTSEVRQRWTTGRMDDERLSTRQSSLVLSSFGPASSVGREAKNCSEYLPIKQIRAIFSKKRLHLSGGSDTIQNIRGFLWKAYKNVIQPHCRLVGGK